MNIILQKVVFNNKTGLEVPLKIEAPIGNTVYGPNNIPSGEKVTISTNQENCMSIRIIVTDRDHGATQDFILAAPCSGRSSYLELVEVEFNVADIAGTVIARAG